MIDRVNISIPEPTLKRLTQYYQYLTVKSESGLIMISCTDIADALNLTSIQVRKDLQMAGAQGKPKVGYVLKELIKIIGNSLGYDNLNEAFLVGVGNFGQLILNYKGFTEYGFKILAAFDNNPAKLNKNINGIQVLNINKFSNLAKRMKIKIGIIAVNAEAAQEVADLMIASGIEAIWNLTHANIDLPKDIINIDVNLASSLSLLLSKLAAKYKN